MRKRQNFYDQLQKSKMRAVIILLGSLIDYSLAFTFATSRIVDQLPLTASSPELNKQPLSLYEDLADNSNFIFASFAGLLQQWPNSFAYSGHSIIPGLIPRSTVLYHGTDKGNSAPTQGFEWLAFDPQMSYEIHSRWGNKTALYSYITTRSLRIIYFDGQSASKGTAGFMDSQAVIINGTVNRDVGNKSHLLEAEYLRASQLCKIGKQWGFEGVVRMNTGFELIWCDFEQGIRLLGSVNTTHPLEDFKKPSPPGPREIKPSNGILIPTSSRFAVNAGWNFARAASRHLFPPGELRVKLDPSGFISFYDGIESLNLKRRIDGTDKGSRSSHRLYGISLDDAQQIQDRLFNVLSRKNAQGWKYDDSNQLDWKDVALSIVQTYNQPLMELAFILSRDDISMSEQMLEVRDSTYGMLMPYIDFSAWNVTNSTWENQAIQRCTKAFTSATDYSDSELNDSVRLIINAIEGTLRRLCRTVHRIFSQSMLLSSLISELDDPISASTLRNETTNLKILEWSRETDDLLKWLGWSSWGTCNPTCKINEICMPPMWPAVMKSNISTYQPSCLNITAWAKTPHL